MPSVSIFYGIIIYVNFFDHMPPHFHAKYGEYWASFDLSGNLIEGDLPPRQRKLVSAWAIMREEELKHAWDDCVNGRNPDDIDPLK